MNVGELIKSCDHIILYMGDGHIRQVLDAAVKKYGKQAVVWDENFVEGGVLKHYKPFEYPTDNLDQWSVVVCMDNLLYAKEAEDRLTAAGYRHIFMPDDLGLEYSVDKLDAIEFNLNIGCSLNCHYCPQKVLLDAYQKYGKEPSKRHLSYEDFKFIVDKRMNPGASVSFSGMSEPFENKDFMKMLLYANENGNTILLNTTLMGLTEQMLDEIIRQDVNLKRILLHIPDNKGNSHFRITDSYIKVLERFLTQYKKKICYLSCHGTAPDQAVRDLVMSAEIEDIHYEEWLGGRCGNLDETIRQVPDRKGRLICTIGEAPVGAPVCMPDGTLALCCNDYALDTCIGNILDHEWRQIALSEGYQTYLKALDDENKEYICRHCSGATRREDAVKCVYPDYYYFGNNFYQVRATAEQNSHPLMQRLHNAEHICIFGIGKFFKDNYFYAGWNKIIRADFLSDNNEKIWGKSFGGIRVIPKQDLLLYKNLLVVVYVTSPDAIIQDLHSMGIQNIMSITEIMHIFEGGPEYV